MSPEERKLLEGLFDRMRSNANTQRDREAEQLINDSVKSQPYAPYLLAQTVIVQDQALQAANERLQQLEQEVQDMHQQGQQPQGGGGFLSGLFGGGAPRQPAPMQQGGVWNQGGAYPPPGGGYPQQGYPQQGGPWGGGMGGGGGSSFLGGALSTAAGVAGGVLMADSIRSLFSSGHAGGGLGIAQGVPGMGGDTTINNYYGDGGGFGGGGGGPTAADWQQDADQDQDDAQDAGDYDDV